jgi:LysM repeat protein
MNFDRRSDQQIKITLGMISFFLIVTMIMAAIPLTSASAVVCKYRHTVQAGENLEYIGQLYNVNYLEIAKANNLTDPYTLMVGEKLCIPGGSDPTIQPDADKDKASFVGYANLGHVYIEIKNFPKLTNYYVRLQTPQGLDITKLIGQREYFGDTRLNFRTDKNGDFAGWFKVPMDMARYPNMEVCVKNVLTDALSCAGYEDYYAYFNALQVIGCKKPVR